METATATTQSQEAKRLANYIDKHLPHVDSGRSSSGRKWRYYKAECSVSYTFGIKVTANDGGDVREFAVIVMNEIGTPERIVIWDEYNRTTLGDVEHEVTRLSLVTKGHWSGLDMN